MSILNHSTRYPWSILEFFFSFEEMTVEDFPNWFGPNLDVRPATEPRPLLHTRGAIPANHLSNVTNKLLTIIPKVHS